MYSGRATNKKSHLKRVNSISVDDYGQSFIFVDIIHRPKTLPVEKRMQKEKNYCIANDTHLPVLSLSRSRVSPVMRLIFRAIASALWTKIDWLSSVSPIEVVHIPTVLGCLEKKKKTIGCVSILLSRSQRRPTSPVTILERDDISTCPSQSSQHIISTHITLMPAWRRAPIAWRT